MDELHTLILDNFPAVSEDTLRKIYTACGISDQDIYKRLTIAAEMAGDVVEQDLVTIFPEIRMSIDRLKNLLPDAKDFTAIKPLVEDALRDIWKPDERIEAKQLITDQARKNRFAKAVNDYIRLIERTQRETQLHIDNLDRDERDAIRPTISNYKTILQIESSKEGSLLSSVWYDEIKRQAVKGATGQEEWTDTNSSNVLEVIEQNYDYLDNERKFNHAFRLFLDERKRNPLKDKLEYCRDHWDGKNRCESFLSDIARADRTKYTMEISKRIFDAGVNRIFNPGCKIDEVPVLIGEQGSGKSKLIEYLALNDDYYTSLSGKMIKLDNMKDTIERMRGFFIIELAEFFSEDKRAEQDALKDFISRTKDTYRTPFDRYPVTSRRNCVFIGSTNNREFLTDLTGNRRFLPIHCNCDPEYIFDHADEVRDYIEQCYGEAVARYEAGERISALSEETQEEAKRRQEAAMVEDYKRGVIREWLEDLPRYFVSGVEQDRRVCGKMVWEECLNRDLNKFSPTQQREITQILRSMSYILEEYSTKQYVRGVNGKSYGQQLAFKKIF